MKELHDPCDQDCPKCAEEVEAQRELEVDEAILDHKEGDKC